MGRHRERLSPEQRQISQRMRRYAGGHGGVITAERSRQLGADSAAVRRLIGSGEWRRTRRGVYRDPGFVPRRLSEAAVAHHSRCADLIAAVGPGAVVSHTSAARLLDLPLPPRTGDEVILTRRPPAQSGRIGRSGRVLIARFDDADVLDLQGVPVLAGARMVLDCCSLLPADAALAIADAAVRGRYTELLELAGELAKRRGRPGSRSAGVVVGRADPLAESWLESVSRWWLAEAGLSPPVLQQRFLDEAGVVRARADFWYPEHRTVGEADGAGKYSEPGSLYAEKRREDWLRDHHRVEVVRWVTAEMTDPRSRADIVDRLQRAFARQAVRPS
jgi:hypothetical protein